MPSYIKASKEVLEKLEKKHNVQLRDVEQCFENFSGKLLMDTRARHSTFPPTYWFLEFTNKNRLLKIVYIQIDGVIHLKSAFEPNDEEKRIYAKYGKK
jgi:uncharacterized DUF497 family protein